VSDLPREVGAWLDPVHAAPAVVLTAVVAYRIRSARHPGPARSLWLALVALTGSAIVHLPPLRDALQQALGPGGVAVATHTFTLAASGFVLLLLAQTTGALDRSRLGLMTAIAMTLMAVPLLLTRPARFVGNLGTPLDGMALPDALAWALHYTAVLGYMAWAMVAVVLLYRQVALDAGPGVLHQRLVLIRAGCVWGLALVATKAAIVAGSFASTGVRWNAPADALQGALLGATLLTIAMGAGWPQLVGAAASVFAEAAAARSLLRLRRLWRLMYEHNPKIALLPPTASSLLLGPLSLRERLYRRVMEVRDGLLDLTPYASAQLRLEVAASAVAQGSEPREAEAVAEAVWITAAVRAKLGGADAATKSTVPPRSVLGGADLRAEVTWLELVADAHAHWPLTRRLEAEHLPSLVDQDGRAA